MTTYISNSSAHHDGSTNVLTLTAPAGIADNDLLVFYGFFNGGTLTHPSGWTHQSSGNSTWAYKVAASESGSYVWSSSVNGKASGAIVVYRGLASTTPGTALTNGSPTNTGSSAATTSETSTYSSPFIIYGYTCDNGANGNPAADAATNQRIVVGSQADTYTLIADESGTSVTVPARTSTNNSNQPLAAMVMNFQDALSTPDSGGFHEVWDVFYGPAKQMGELGRYLPYKSNTPGANLYLFEALY